MFFVAALLPESRALGGEVRGHCLLRDGGWGGLRGRDGRTL